MLTTLDGRAVTWDETRDEDVEIIDFDLTDVPSFPGQLSNRVNSAALLIDHILAIETPGFVIDSFTRRLIHLDQVDALLAALPPGRDLPPEAVERIARDGKDPLLLDRFLDRPELRSALLSNDALTFPQLAQLVKPPVVGRPEDGPEYWARLLDWAATRLREDSDIPNPGGFESGELRECGPAGGRIFGMAAPVCREASVAVHDEGSRPAWVSPVITWAIELAHAIDSVRAHVRLGVRLHHLTRADIPDVAQESLREGAIGLRRLAEQDAGDRALAEAAAVLLDALADDRGSVSWLRHYDRDHGYGHVMIFELVALATSSLVLDGVRTAGPTTSR